MFVVEIDGSKGTASRTRADATTVNELWRAGKVLSIDGKGVGVLVEGLLELLALVQLVCLVFAGPGGVGTSAKQNLRSVNIYVEPWVTQSVISAVGRDNDVAPIMGVRRFGSVRATTYTSNGPLLNGRGGNGDGR